MVPSLRERPVFGIWSLLGGRGGHPGLGDRVWWQPGLELKLPSWQGYQEEGCSYPK